ncbi:secretion protein EspD [Mycolicibacterium celeriflavum]|uniref:secretion protein EspD n=1 Tax=Mycolicibacterium celeriflavum TaxID=1249101 RepID=UPI0007FD0BBA|nr:secretion protein EspD [Mycolicibacterium celeriflavum]OBG12539.1 secretion protein EspD [Mycolicibacterium celeriflavum]
MAGEMPPERFDDERDDLVALGSFDPGDAPDDDSSDSVLDALAVYAPAEPVENPESPLFTVTNPTATVGVSTFLDGRISQIDLSPKAAELTEADLAAEVVVIAGLATQEAKSAQHAMMLEGMREQGHDDAATRDFLSRDLDLPSPEQARAERARVFATRYAGDDD